MRIILSILLFAISLSAGTIGTIYRPTADRVVYKAATLPASSARSSAVYCLDCLRDASCTAGTPGSRLVGAMAFTRNGTGDWVCDTGVAQSIPDSFIPAISGGVCVGSGNDMSGCVDGQQVRLIGTKFLPWHDFWSYWARRVVATTINEMRREVCRNGLSACEVQDRNDLDARDAAEDSIRARNLPSE